MEKIRLAAPIQTDSCVDGSGLRFVVWTQGCIHNCEGCHNPLSHDLQGGISCDLSELLNEITNLDYHTGITFSGGEPMLQAKKCTIIADKVKELGMNVWCYTGYRYEDLLTMNDDIQSFLEKIDVLVDGKFELNLKTLDCKFRGSSNQRCIDMKKTRESKEICTLY